MKMKEFRVYEHPALGLRVVKAGFSWPALSFGLLWMAYRRLWRNFGRWFALYVLLCFMTVLTVGSENAASQDVGLTLLCQISDEPVGFLFAFPCRRYAESMAACRC